ERGFNQAERIAQGIEQVWKVPIRTDILVRVKNTAPQSRINSRQERMENIAGAFEVRSPEVIRGRKLLLIDDIFTTGTTVNEALKVLRAANPTSVDVLTLARTRPSE
ncbi:ComF family protein, partial [Candidatus Poribacteria bacterium]|nr:ComF family protein [Candidatus Poribacteria bacterium]